MRIRAFEQGDADEVVALWRACGLIRAWNDPVRDLERKRDEHPELFLVALDDAGRVTGTVMGGYDGHRGWANYLGTLPERRGEGIAAALVRELERRLVELGCPKLNLQVREGNDAALGFYDRLGYTPDAVVSLGKRLIADASAGERTAG